MYLLSQRRKRAKGQAGCVDYFLEVPLDSNWMTRRLNEQTIEAMDSD